MSNSGDVRAGGAYVEVFAKNEGLEQNLQQSTRKLLTWATATKAIVGGALTVGGTILGAGITGVAIAGKAVASTMERVGSSLRTSSAGGRDGFASLTAVVERLVPLSTRLWDVTQTGVGRGIRLLGTLRTVLASAGPAARPLLDVFDNLAKRGANITWGARLGSAIRGDVSGALATNPALKFSREAYLQDRTRGFGSNIAEGAGGLGRSLAGISSLSLQAARNLTSFTASSLSAAVQSTGLGSSLTSTNGRFGQLVEGASVVASAMKAGIGRSLEVVASLSQEAARRLKVVVDHPIAQGLLTAGRGFGRAAGQALSFANIRGGYLLTGATGLGLQLTGKTLGLVAGLGLRATRSFTSVASGSVQAATRLTGLNNVLQTTDSRLGGILPKLSGFSSVLRSGALRAAGIGAGVLGVLTAAAGISGSISELFSAHGFAKHAVAEGNEADKRKVTAETYSTYHSAAQIAGTTLDDAKNNPAKMAAIEAAKNRAISLGGFVTARQVALAREGTEASAEMGIAFRSVGTALGSAVLPQLIEGVKWVTNTAVAVANFINQNPKLIQQLFSIGRAFAVGAALAGALAAGIGFIASPVGLAAVAIGTLAAAFPTLWASAKEHLGFITGSLETLASGFQVVLGGIVNSLSAGSLELAAEVAMAGLMVAWETGIAWLDSQWRDWSTSLANVIDAGLTEARIKLDEWFPGFEEGFSGSMAFLQDAWTTTVNVFLNVWEKAQAILAKSINYLVSLFKRGFDLKGANEAVEAEFNKKAIARGNETATLLAKRTMERAQHALGIQQNGVRGQLNAELEERKAQREEAKDAGGVSSKRLQDAKDRLNLALQEAQAAKEAEDERRSKQIEVGSLASVAGATRATQGAAANDIRTREGLADILVAFRGKDNWQTKLVDKTTEHVEVAKKSHETHERTYRKLEDIDTDLQNLDKPIS